MNDNKENKSPYDKFKVIMDKAAGTSTADYEGHGRFWNTLSLEALQKVTIYGVRMIAPKEDFDATGSYQPEPESCCAPKKSCCSDDTPSTDTNASASAAVQQSFPGRGAASGLVKGLKGEFPYDDTQFPRLPFDGSQVTVEHIQFIENWIDAGCPKDEMPEIGIDPTATLYPLSSGQKAHPPVVNSNAYKYESGELVQRKNAAYLPKEELAALREAMQEIIALNKFPLDTRSFNAYAKIHGDSCQHGWEQFLPWHRAFLYEFEQLLQDYVPGVALPYWDWTMPAYNNGLVPKGGVSGIVPEIYRCSISAQALNNLSNQGVDAQIIQGLKTLQDKLYNSGTECVWEAEAAVGANGWTPELEAALYAQLKLTNPLFHRYRYPGMFYQTVQSGVNKGAYVKGSDGRPVLINSDNPLAIPYHHHYPTSDEIDDILAIDNWPQFGGGHYANQSFGALSQNPHNTGHIWSGGQNPMANPLMPNGPGNIVNGDMFNDLVAFFDPIAWGHHSNVDRLWWKWQSMHPGHNPEDLTDIMVPWQYSVQQLLNISKLGYEYALGSKLFSTNPGTPMIKFKSEDAQLPNNLLKNHAKAEVRLHKVQQSTNSHYIRVFLNTPDADHTTPTKGNDNFVGYIARFGHGDCVGGPGHCAIPPTNKRKFDQRPRHHNTPTNHTLDATKNIKKLLDKGASDIHVNVVALGHDGQLADGASRLLMDGVSLNFFD